ncbi:MAG: hypothetical protein QE263_08260 [Vampirovibrionales bacterium]|nr:hypothetical protein [Vampirovibrionales bacterium]
MSKLIISLLAATVMLSSVASAATEVTTISEGETLKEYQSLGNPYVDRREIRASEGSSTVDLSKWNNLTHQDRIGLNFVNDTDKAVNITLPQIPANFVVPANSSRTYEYVATQIGNTNSLTYEVTSLDGPAASYLAQSQALTEIINSKIIIPTFSEEKQLTYVRSTSDYKPAKTTSKMVRGYW